MEKVRVRELAKELGMSSSKELLAFLQDRKAELVAVQAEFAAKSMEELQAEVEELDKQIGTASPRDAEFLSRTRDAKLAVFGLRAQEYDALVSAAATPGTLLIVQEASPTEVVQVGFQPPRSRIGRLLLAGTIGLLVGLGLALLLERFDTRIRTKEAAERHFGLPVLAEIPAIPRRRAGAKGIVTSDRPTSPAADGFRLLAASIGRAPSGNGARRGPLPAAPGRVQSILVTSAAPGEGKSIVVANLAAAFSQMLQRVLVLSCDLRHPYVHRLLGVENGGGLADVLRKRQDGQPVLDSYVKKTLLPGVQLVPSGPPPPQPSSLLTTETMRRALEEARELADVVILDTPPILHASDAAHLIEEVDLVLLVARAGSTRVEQAARASELLKRLDAPVAGVALNQSAGMAGGRRDRAGSGGLHRDFPN